MIFEMKHILYSGFHIFKCNEWRKEVNLANEVLDDVDELWILEFWSVWRTKFVLGINSTIYFPKIFLHSLVFYCKILFWNTQYIWNQYTFEMWTDIPVSIQLHWICKSMSSSPLFMNSLKREITGLMQHQDLILQAS